MNIRNFGIIAHIDHGKSTLADRMLEVTNTVPKREMKEQLLDSMELERERGITIKMQPVRMLWKEHILNLIDTPGHIDFSYEVSRALKAVEGVILLVDATQGVQAQTLSVLNMARVEGLTILPAVSKIDSPRARVQEVKAEISKLLDCNPDSILEVSGKTGQGVEKLLDAIVERIPHPNPSPPPCVEAGTAGEGLQALVFDFKYSTHRGITVFVRMMGGEVRAKDNLTFGVAGHNFVCNEVGVSSPKEKPVEALRAGEIGYLVTGIKEPGVVSVGDTIGRRGERFDILPGYERPMPMVWASIYPESEDDFPELKKALLTLKLTDSSIVFDEESSSILGKGFRVGFLGMLHLEIVSERLKREFDLELIITSPSIIYDVVYKGGKRERVYSPSFFPDDGLLEEVYEPMARIKIITPSEYISDILKILYEHEAVIEVTDNFGDDRTVIECDIPLRELMRGFFDQLKSGSKGYASLSYEMAGEQLANVTRLDLLINDEVEPAFSRVVSKRIVEAEAERMVERLYNTLGRQMIQIKIQGRAGARIISSKTLSALRKDVTQHMYGGDITRKMKLREKQKKGKKKMQARGTVRIPQDVFMKMIKPE